MNSKYKVRVSFKISEMKFYVELFEYETGKDAYKNLVIRSFTLAEIYKLAKILKSDTYFMLDL